MNIVILGAGTVGTSIAHTLCGNRQNVTLIDSSREALNRVEERLDVQTVCGSACDATTLFQAGVLSSELTLAVTGHDEVNLVGASLCKSMGVRRSIARVFNPAYLDASTFDYRRHFQIDRLLSLEYLTALELAKSARAPGLFAVENFARGGIEVQELAVEQDAPAADQKLRELKLPAEVRIGLISDGRRGIIAGADDVVSGGQHVTLIGTRDKLEEVKPLFERRAQRKLNVVIAGGGEIGFNLARILEQGRFKVVLLEADAQRCEKLATRLNGTTVLHADATRLSELAEARVGKADVFVAATGHDEDNIVCGVEARELGSGRILSVVRRPDYTNVVQKLGIDCAVSPREVMARQVLGMVEHGPILVRSEISGGDAEIWEMEVLEGAPITKGPLRSFDMPHSLVAAVVREDFVHVPGADDQLRPGDTVVLLVQKPNTSKVLAMFEPAK